MVRLKFDSEAFYGRLYSFARRSQELVIKLPKTVSNHVYGGQLIRSSGSTGANYLEALEATGGNDFIYRLRVSRKETRESIHWLRLIKDTNGKTPEIAIEAESLIQEAQELKRIFTSSILTLEQKRNNK